MAGWAHGWFQVRTSICRSGACMDKATCMRIIIVEFNGSVGLDERFMFGQIGATGRTKNAGSNIVLI
jgi:hypothetical protein